MFSKVLIHADPIKEREERTRIETETSLTRRQLKQSSQWGKLKAYVGDFFLFFGGVWAYLLDLISNFMKEKNHFAQVQVHKVPPFFSSGWLVTDKKGLF